MTKDQRDRMASLLDRAKQKAPVCERRMMKQPELANFMCRHFPVHRSLLLVEGLRTELERIPLIEAIMCWLTPDNQYGAAFPEEIMQLATSVLETQP